MLPGKKITPDFVLGAVRRRWWLIAAPLVVVAFGALVYSSFLPDVFVAQTLIQIVPQRVPDSYVRSTVTLRIDTRIESVARQVLSGPRLEQLINEFNLYPQERAEHPTEEVVGRMRAASGWEMVPPPRGQAPDAF